MMQAKWMEFFNKAIVVLLVLLGFSSCDDDDPIMGQEEYGTPHVTYKLKGKVVNPQDSPVKDIQIIVKTDPNSWKKDTLYTDGKGEFMFENSVWPGSKLNVIYEDVRDQDIVFYKTDSILVTMDKPTGGTGWYEGESYKEITIKLEEKREIE